MDLTINYLKKLLTKSDVIVLGCSGGPDSMCLLHLLCQLKDTIGFRLIVAHMNHNVRSVSQSEAEFVQKSTLLNDCTFEYTILNE